MKQFDLKLYSFNEVEPITLEDVKGGTASEEECCKINNVCNVNTCSSDCRDNCSTDLRGPIDY